MSRVLLARSADRDAIDAFALAEDLSLVQVLARREGRPEQLTFATPDGGALITFVDDHRIAARYAVVQSLTVDPVVASIERGLPHVSLGQVLTLLDDPEHRQRALCWLGIVAPPAPDERIAPILRAARQSEREDERVAASFAWEAAGWSAEA